MDLQEDDVGAVTHYERVRSTCLVS
jgi:hypothetical protein